MPGGGQSVIAEYTETGSGTIPTFTKSYVYAGSRLLAVSYSDGLLEFHHPDRIGTQLVTFGGTIGTVRQSTYPFGTLEQGPRSNQVFTSYDRSTNTGLDYAVNRTYSSGQSRFTQVDPIGMNAASVGNPQSNNLYAYVQNMPTDFVDPSGLDIPDIGGFDGGTVYGDRDPIWGILRGMMGSDSIPMTVIITPPGMDLPGDGGGGNTISSGDSLSDCAKKLLQRFFPALNLNAINLTLGLPSWAPSQTTSGEPIGGITVGNTIYTSGQSAFESRHGATRTGSGSGLH